MKTHSYLFLVACTLLFSSHSAIHRNYGLSADAPEIYGNPTEELNHWPPSSFSSRVERDVMVPMDDGVKLATDVYLPEGTGPFPVIVERTPYGRGDDEGFRYTERGYAFVIQSCRGRANSEGEWEPFVNERADGLATHNWILEQPWCNGKIATPGGSYTGLTEWAIAAHTGPSHKALFATNPVMDAYHDLTNIGGAFGIGTLMHWGSLMVRPEASER